MYLDDLLKREQSVFQEEDKGDTSLETDKALHKSVRTIKLNVLYSSNFMAFCDT